MLEGGGPVQNRKDLNFSCNLRGGIPKKKRALKYRTDPKKRVLLTLGLGGTLRKNQKEKPGKEEENGGGGKSWEKRSAGGH